MTESAPAFHISAYVLSSADADGLATFYERLLSWPRTWNEPGWVMINPGSGAPGLSFQTEENYRPPIWPARGDQQQLQAHLDIRVDDLSAATARAIQLGAHVATYQPQEAVMVCLDPAGHPFCLFAE